MWSTSYTSRQRAGFVFGACGLVFIFLYLSYFSNRFTEPIAVPFAEAPPQRNLSTVRVTCRGPRGLLDQSLGDHVQAKKLSSTSPDPTPVGGCYYALNLTTEYNTPASRYAPYGYGEDTPDYDRARVDWAQINWAALQNDCRAINQDRFQRSRNISTSRKFRLRNGQDVTPPPLKYRPSSPPRTAIVLRAWEGYKFTPNDHHHLRSLIVEAGLASNADYAVFLLVDVKDKEGQRRIFHDPHSYQKAIEEIVHPEYQSISVLFDRELLESWYPRVEDHSVFDQVYQPMQLFAQLFPEFDHYWQLEMDIRITGDSRLLLDSLSEFARKEPRKQSVERSSYYYMPQIHGHYDEFTASINQSLDGGGIWGPIEIPDIAYPVGPRPPVADPRQDDFEWGVGEDADLILTNALADVKAAKFWPFQHWIHGFKKGEETPRFYSPVAMGRYSWKLLNAMHYSQATQGLALPSEASPASFALYHGLKVSFPPLPWFHRPQADREVSVQELDKLYNGGTPAENAQSNNGLSFGQALYNPDGVYELFNGKTWWWVPGYPGNIFKHWIDQDSTDMPDMLRESEGQVWAPLMALHPVKPNDFN